MKSENEFPKVIRAGNVSVKIYRNKHPRTASGWIYQLTWISPTGRKVQQFADFEDAIKEARLKAGKLSTGEIEAAGMNNSDRLELLEARRLAAPLPLLAALQEWQKAREMAGGHLIAAAESFANRNLPTFDVITIKDAVERFLDSKKKAGVDVSASYKKVLPTLVEAFGGRSLNTVSSRELMQWMETRHPNPVTRNTVRKRIVTLWKWARKQGYLPRDAISEAEQTETAQEEHAEIGVIDAKTYRALLELFSNNHPEYLAALVLAGFCGLRRSEVHSQTWEDIYLDRKFVRVTAAKRNTPARRLVPLCAAAIKWLRLCRDRNGNVCENLALDRIREIARAAKFDLPDNCFRHSYISHRVAVTGNVAETALEAGNSPQIIFRHYRELFTKSEGKAWFAIEPVKAGLESATPNSVERLPESRAEHPIAEEKA